MTKEHEAKVLSKEELELAREEFPLDEVITVSCAEDSNRHWCQRLLATIEAKDKEIDGLKKKKSWAQGFKDGVKSVWRDNPSGCCCEINDMDVVVSMCGLHAELRDKAQADLSELLLLVKKAISRERSLLEWCIEPDKKFIYKGDIDRLEQVAERIKEEK